MRIHPLSHFPLVVLLFPLVCHAQTQGLISAAKRGDVNAVETLLSEGADVNARSRYGATALSFACDRGHLEVAQFLIDAGADIHVKDTFYNATPLSWAASGKHGAIVRLLLENGAKEAEDALRTGVEEGAADVVRAVLDLSEVEGELLLMAKAVAEVRGYKDVAGLLERATREVDAPTEEIPEAVLSTYVGRFRNQDARELTIELKNGMLLLSTRSRNPVTLFPKNESTFEYFGTAYTFNLNEGEVESLTRGSNSSESVYFRFDPHQDAVAAATNPSSRIPPIDSSRIGTADQTVSSRNWPSYRGTGGRGIADGHGAPVEWNVETKENVTWKTSIPGLAHSSPIVWNDQIFVTTAVNKGGDHELRIGLYGDVESVQEDFVYSWRVYCLDKKTGAIVWERTAAEGVPQFKRHPKSSHANSTPVTDGKHLVACFGSEGLYCYDLDGQLLWKKDLGPLNSGWFYDEDFEWGFSSSPIIYHDTVILQCDIQDDSFLAAYDVRSGETVWETPRDEIPSWGTPTVYEDANTAVLITNASRFARGYDPVTGEELWRLSGQPEITVPTPFVAHGLIFISNGYRPIKPIYAIRLNARGDISLKEGESSNEHIVWSTERGGPYLPTPIVYGDFLHVCTNDGIASCYEAKTGEMMYRKRLRGDGGRSFSAAPVAADGNLYFTSEEGVVFVVKAGPHFEVLSANPVGEFCMATPALSEGVFYIRTDKSLIAISGGRSSASAE